METAQQSSLRNLLRLENIPFALMTALIVLLPLLFVISESVSFYLSKSFLVVVAVLVSFVCVLVSSLKRGTVTFPKSLVLAGLSLVTLVYLLSTLFSASSARSFFGLDFEITTFVFMLGMLVLTFLVSISFKEKSRLGVVYTGFFLVSAILGLFHAARFIFGADFLSLGVFANVISNSIGKWNEVGIFFGVTAILSLLAIDILRTTKTVRTFLYILLVLSLGMLVAVNFSVVWYVFAAIVFLMFVYQTASGSLASMTVTSIGASSGVQQGMEQDVERSATSQGVVTRRRVAIKPLIVLIIAVLIALPIGQDLSRTISAKFGVDNVEVRPSWSATYEVFKGTVKDDPVLGVGPNRFSNAWELYKPDVNFTNFWNVSFGTGIGFVPTSFTETGILGLLTWLVFFFTFLYSGFVALGVRTTSSSSRYFVASSFFAALFLWVMTIVYSPSIVMFVLTFFFTGLFVAAAISSGAVQVESFVFGKKQTASFVVSAVVVVMLVLTLGLGYMLSAQAMAAMHFQKAISGVQKNESIAAVSEHLARALSLSEKDAYYRSLAELHLLRINTIVAVAASKADVTEAERTDFQNELAAAVESGRLAIEEDATNFENHVITGNIYSAIVPLAVEGSYDAAKGAFERALALSPRNPGIYLALARLEGAKGDLAAAESYVAKALELKPNYLDAIFLQTQISVTRGDLKKATLTAEQFTMLAPQDPLSYFRVGLLKYESKDYRGAVTALEKSISLVPVYANAQYFLGLSYAKIGRQADAVRSFETIQAANPENTEIRSILSNLQAGRDAFAAAVADTKPEKRGKLPIEE